MYNSIKKSLNNQDKKSDTNSSNNDENEDHKDNKDFNELIFSENNHIYFYDDVNTKNILKLIRLIKQLENKLVIMKADINSRFECNTNLNIYLHINSGGGYITDAFAALNYIKNCKVPITSIIDGYAASAATFLSIVCHKRHITEYSTMLIHQLSGAAYGTYENIQDDNSNNVMLQNKIIKLYKKYSRGKLRENRLKEILKHDIMWDAETCLKYGLVDEIV
jgi:ATP-dependent Clp protease, protease subunit